MKNILILEDEPSLSKSLSQTLKRAKFAVTAVANGRDGLTAAEAHHPDLIILDILMPIMDGLTVLRELRQKPWAKKIPVIILSNLTLNEKQLKEFTQRPHAQYLVKADTKLKDIVNAVKKLTAEK
ncbi:MAG: response regulator [Candidatus Komeilibacteria bacterium]